MSLLTDEQVEQALTERPDWRREDKELVCDRSFKDFAEAMSFVNAVARVAEDRNHHPDILVHGWNNVRLRVSTHSEGGLTEADLGLVDAVDALS